MSKKELKNSPKILGLDVSTKTIGWALFDLQSKELLELTHISPQPKPKSEDKIEELLKKYYVKYIKYMNIRIKSSLFYLILIL